MRWRKTSDEAPLQGGGGMKYAPLALLRRRLLLPVLALGCLLLPGECTSTPFQEHTKRGLKHMEELGGGGYLLAEPEFREALRLNPNDPGAHTNLGNALLLQHKNAEGEKEFREAVWLKPDFAEAHCGLGRAFLGQKRIKEAENELLIALSLNPKNAVAVNALGVVLYFKGDTVGAEKKFRDAIRLKPDYVDALEDLALVLQERKNPEAAIYWHRVEIIKGKNRDKWPKVYILP